MVKADEAFVFETFLRGYKRGSYYAKRIRDRRFYPAYHRVIEDLLARGRTLVACPEGDPDTILGYVIAEEAKEPVLHWCFVKLAWRRLGIATALIESALPEPEKAVFTHWTSWHLSVPAPKGVDRGNQRLVREARAQTVRTMEQAGEAGGDAEALLRKWPTMEYDPSYLWRHNG